MTWRGGVVAAVCFVAGCAGRQRPVARGRRPPCQAEVGPSVFGRDSELAGVGGVGTLAVIGTRKGSASAIGEAFTRAPPPHQDEPLEGVDLRDVRLEHGTLGRGARSDAEAVYDAPAGAHLFLEGKTPVAGYGFKLPIDASRDGVTFWVGCYADRPRHLVRWSFTLRDEAGRRSNTVRKLAAEDVGVHRDSAPDDVGGLVLPRPARTRRPCRSPGERGSSCAR